jgi:ABC-type metal ion transport system, periplasmic component/surface antigen
MKKLIALLIALALTLSLTAALADTITIAVPNDPTNEGRALLLLQSQGVLTLKEGSGLEATKGDIESSIVDIELVEVEAALVPEIKQDVDYAIINNNYALQAGLNPVEDSLLIESADSPYVNVVSVKEGNENSDEAKALAAALQSQKVVDFINNTYAGAAVATVTEITDGFDATVDYEALKGTTISIAATPVPHVEVLKIAAEILAEKGITLDVKEVTDYVTPNEFVENGDVFANYFAHQPYQDSFNAGNGTHLVTIAGIHVEPMALYGGKQADLAALGIAK